jgi:hypothetical protein
MGEVVCYLALFADQYLDTEVSEERLPANFCWVSGRLKSLTRIAFPPVTAKASYMGVMDAPFGGNCLRRIAIQPTAEIGDVVICPIGFTKIKVKK